MTDNNTINAFNENNDNNENNKNNEISVSKKPDFRENSDNFYSGIVNVGEILRNERIKQHLGIDAVAQSIKISKRQVEYIENQQWDKLPEKMIILGFVRNYAKFLHLDEQNLIDLLANNQNLEKQIKLEISKGVQFETSSIFKKVFRIFGDIVTSKKSFIFILLAIVVAVVAFLASNTEDFAADFKNLEETIQNLKNFIASDSKENTEETTNSTNMENSPNAENSNNLNSFSLDNNSETQNQSLLQSDPQNLQSLTNTNEVKTDNSSNSPNSSLNSQMFDSNQNQFQLQMPPSSPSQQNSSNDEATTTNQAKNKDNTAYQYPW